MALLVHVTIAQQQDNIAQAQDTGAQTFTVRKRHSGCYYTVVQQHVPRLHRQVHARHDTDLHHAVRGKGPRAPAHAHGQAFNHSQQRRGAPLLGFANVAHAGQGPQGNVSVLGTGSQPQQPSQPRYHGAHQVKTVVVQVKGGVGQELQNHHDQRTAL